MSCKFCPWIGGHLPISHRGWSGRLKVIRLLAGLVSVVWQGCVCGQIPSTDGMYGQTGIVMTPVATLQTDRQLTFGWQFVPARQAHLEYSQKNGVGEQVYFARLGFLPWAEASIRLVHPDQARNGSYGIGDRSIFVKLRALREKKYRPALAVAIYDPIGTRLLPATCLLATKSFPLTSKRVIQVTSGYGGEWFGDEDYLVSGFWAGCQFLPAYVSHSWWPQWSAGMEFHRQQLNVSAGLNIRSLVRINAYLIDLRDLSVSVSASIGL